MECLGQYLSIILIKINRSRGERGGNGGQWACKKELNAYPMVPLETAG